MIADRAYALACTFTDSPADTAWCSLVARSSPDGYTWLATSVPFATAITLHPKSLRYHPVTDFQPIANLGTSSFVLVVPTDVPAKTVAEFVA